MEKCVDFEIGLHRREVECYTIELRSSPPESSAEVRLVRSSLTPTHLDFQRLLMLGADPDAYGQYLSQTLFGDREVLRVFAEARAIAQAKGIPLRLRLFVGPSVPELHSVRWETLRDPDDGNPLLMGELIYFSRFLSSQDWRPVRLHSRSDLRALVVIANPANLADYRPGGRPLAPLDVKGELDRAEVGLGSIPVTALASGGSATLDEMIELLREGYEILYLVCHGALVDGGPRLYLENRAGQVDVVSGTELVTRLKEMQDQPRLVVLASCQSAGKGEASLVISDEGALAALGPRLAETGIPAVLAMQGNITLQTLAAFMPVFFKELQKDGQIDRAMALARGAVRNEPDWWMPVLFMRYSTGRLWYESGFGDQELELKEWPAIISYIQKGKCTPILGPDLTESLLGSRRDIARNWADRYSFPMAPQDREDLPQVSQYLAVQLGTMFPRDELGAYLEEAIWRRYGKDLPEDLRHASLDDLLTAVGAQLRQQDELEPHRVLAGLPLPIYVTTDPSNLLASALAAEAKDPQVVLCPWNENARWVDSVYEMEPTYLPNPQRPLVYHLFGRIVEPDSLVLTEDDYFDFLIGATKEKTLIPPRVRRALVDSALLFLGFHMGDWGFRVLFRSLMSQESSSRRRRYPHVAVQIDPEQGTILEPERARQYLESYFQDAHISIYWGSAKAFLRDLTARLEGGAL